MEEILKSTNKKAKTKKVISIISIILAIMLSFVCGFFTRHFLTPSASNLTSEMIAIMEQYAYVMDSEGNLQNLNANDYANALITGFKDKDGYAKYYTKEEYQKIKDQQKGQYTGFGITINVEGEYPIIISVVHNSPAEKAGLKPNDKVISATIDGNAVQFNTVDIGEFLEGVATNKKVEFIVERNGQNQTITVIKSRYKVNYVEYYDNQGQVIFDFEKGTNRRVEDKKIDVDSDTALIKIDSFEGDVAYQFSKALEYMETNSRTKLILDLRDNGGGYMDDLLSVSRHLIYNGGKKTLIAYSQGKKDSQSFYMYGPIERKNIKDVVVLANENTASASECLIGAMLCYGEKNFTKERLILEKNDNDIAKTYGKGIMQSTFLLSSGGAFKLTTARILWPDTKTCIHGTGITTIPENEVNAGQDAIIRAKEILALA